MDSVYFAFDSSLLEPQARQSLDKSYDCLESRDSNITIEGHADPRGTTEYNMALGDRRARRVEKYLAREGADPTRFRVTSKGEEEATGYNEATWAHDRRVDFKSTGPSPHRDKKRGS